MSSFNPANSSAVQLAQPGALELNTPAPSTLSDPPSMQVHFDAGEFNAAQVIKQQDVIVLQVPSILPNRKLYAAVWTNATNAAENWVLCRVTFLLNGTVVGSLPLSVGVTTAGTPTTLTQILPSAINGGGYPQTDSFVLTLDNPQTWSAINAFLHPLHIKATFDSIKVSVTDFFGTSNLKIWIGCLSYAA